MTLVINPLIRALPADHGVDVLQQLREGKLFILDDKLAGLNTAHIQNVVDEIQQVFC